MRELKTAVRSLGFEAKTEELKKMVWMAMATTSPSSSPLWLTGKVNEKGPARTSRCSRCSTTTPAGSASATPSEATRDSRICFEGLNIGGDEMQSMVVQADRADGSGSAT